MRARTATQQGTRGPTHVACCPSSALLVHAQLHCQHYQPCRRHGSLKCAAEHPTSSGVTTTEPTVERPNRSATGTAASQACSSLLPPLGRKATSLRVVEDGVWVLEQNFLITDRSFDARNNAFVVRLQDGGLLVTSASISLTQEARELVAAIPGTIRHIVVNSANIEHWLYLPDWLSVAPDATVWAIPGWRESSALAGRLNKNADVAGTLAQRCTRSDGSPPDVREFVSGVVPAELAADRVSFHVFTSNPPLIREAAVYIGSKKSVVTADLLMCRKDLDGASPVVRWTAQAAGVDGKLGALLSLVMMSNRDEARAWRDEVLGLDFDRVWCSHLAPVGCEAPDGKAQFRQALKFLD